jgi:hypothetical protein
VPRRSSAAYSRMFSAFAAGLFFLVTGVIGWDIRYLHGLFAGGKWVDAPIWWQIGLGAVFLLLGAFLLRRLEPDLTFSRRGQ